VLQLTTKRQINIAYSIYTLNFPIIFTKW